MDSRGDSYVTVAGEVRPSAMLGCLYEGEWKQLDDLAQAGFVKGLTPEVVEMVNRGIEVRDFSSRLVVELEVGTEDRFDRDGKRIYELVGVPLQSESADFEIRQRWVNVVHRLGFPLDSTAARARGRALGNLLVKLANESPAKSLLIGMLPTVWQLDNNGSFRVGMVVGLSKFTVEDTFRYMLASERVRRTNGMEESK